MSLIGHHNLIAQSVLTKGRLMISILLVAAFSSACIGGSPAVGLTYQGPILKVTVMKTIPVPQVAYSSVMNQPHSGNNLDLTLYDIRFVEEIFSQPEDGTIASINPPSDDYHFVLVQAGVKNTGDTAALLDFDKAPPLLTAQPRQAYTPVIVPDTDVPYYSYNLDGDEQNIPLLRGNVLLNPGASLAGWLVFESPKPATLLGFTWAPGDYIEVNFEGEYLNETLTPALTGNELLLVNAVVGNHAANKVQLDIDSTPAELRTKDGGIFFSLNLPGSQAHYFYKDSATQAKHHIPIIRGVQELGKDFELDGWLVFDLPKSAEIEMFKWTAGGDVIAINF